MVFTEATILKEQKNCQEKWMRERIWFDSLFWVNVILPFQESFLIFYVKGIKTLSWVNTCIKSSPNNFNCLFVGFWGAYWNWEVGGELLTSVFVTFIKDFHGKSNFQ